MVPISFKEVGNQFGILKNLSNNHYTIIFKGGSLIGFIHY